MLIDYERILNSRHSFPSVLSKVYRQEDLLNDILQYLLQEDGGKDNNTVFGRIRLVEYLGEYCTDILSGPDEAEKVISLIIKRLIRNSDVVKPSVLVAYLITCTTVVTSFQDEIKVTEGDRSRSATVSSQKSVGCERKLEVPLIQTLIKFLTQDSKQTLGHAVENNVLQCLLELERAIPGCLVPYLSVLYEDYKTHLGPNKQLWNLLMILGVRNFLKRIVKSPEFTQRRITYVLLRGSKADLKGFNCGTASSFFTYFDLNGQYSSHNEDVNVICKLCFEQWFQLETPVQLQMLSYLSEVKLFYGFFDDGGLLADTVTHLSKLDSLAANLVAVLIFQYCIRNSSSIAQKLLDNFEKSARLNFRSYISNIWYLKLAALVGKLGKLDVAKSTLQPRLPDRNAVLLEKVCKFVEITYTVESCGINHHFFSLLKLFTKQIDRQAINFVHHAVFRVLLQAFMYHGSCESAIKVIVLDLCAKHSFLCLPITQLLKSMWKLRPESSFPDSCLSSFSESIANCSFDQFLPFFADYLPLMSLVASKSSADLDGFLELLEKSLMLSEVCYQGSNDVGNGLVEIFHNVLESERRENYCPEVICLLQYVVSNFRNEAVRDNASLYLNLSSTVAPKKLGHFFQSVPRDVRPSKAQFETFIAAHNSTFFGATNVVYEAERELLDLDTICVLKSTPNQYYSEDIKLMSKNVKRFFSRIQDVNEYLDFTEKPQTIHLLFETSINLESETTEFYALEFTVDIGTSLSIRPETTKLSLDYLANESSKILEVEAEVHEVKEFDLKLNCVAIDEQLTTCSSPVSSIPVRFHDYCLPFYCSPSLRPDLFQGLWDLFKDQIQFADNSAADLIYSVEHQGKFDDLKTILQRLLHADCLIPMKEQSSNSGKDESKIALGIFLPPECHLLIQIIHQHDFVIFHCVISNNELCPFLTSFLISLENLYRTFNRSFFS